MDSVKIVSYIAFDGANTIVRLNLSEAEAASHHRNLVVSGYVVKAVSHHATIAEADLPVLKEQIRSLPESARWTPDLVKSEPEAGACSGMVQVMDEDVVIYRGTDQALAESIADSRRATYLPKFTHLVSMYRLVEIR